MLFVSSKIVSDEAPHSPKSFVRVLPKNNNNIINRVSCSCHHNNIWKFTHHFVPRSAYFGLVCYIVICVFVLSLFLSLLFGYITHTHTDRHTQPYKIIIKILFFSFLFFFFGNILLWFSFASSSEKGIFWEKEKKVFRVVRVWPSCCVSLQEEEEEKKIIKRSNNFLVLDWRIFKWISIVCCIYIY